MRLFRKLLILLLVVPLASAACGAGRPQRVISLNLCADQLVMALADRSQIAGLTEWASDPELSFYADRAKGLPITFRSAEEVLARHPDLVIGTPYRTQILLEPLRKRGVTMLDLKQQDATGLAGIEQSIRAVAQAVGHPERGEALIASIHVELADIGPPPGRGRMAAYYQRQGFLTGTDTLVDEIMHRVGLVNLAGRFGRSPLAQIPLEQLALARPDFVVTEQGTRFGDDRSGAMARHPLLDMVLRPGHHLYIPQALTVCGGPGYPRAVAILAQQIRDADGMVKGPPHL